MILVVTKQQIGLALQLEKKRDNWSILFRWNFFLAVYKSTENPLKIVGGFDEKQVSMLLHGWWRVRERLLASRAAAMETTQGRGRRRRRSWAVKWRRTEEGREERARERESKKWKIHAVKNWFPTFIDLPQGKVPSTNMSFWWKETTRFFLLKKKKQRGNFFFIIILIKFGSNVNCGDGNFLEKTSEIKRRGGFWRKWNDLLWFWNY